ncbi:MAG: LuxR C-terminal-related transcriptional regulator [Anaerolineae bacterium]
MLQTKIFIPSPKRFDVDRTHLLEQLHSVDGIRLILISAGAGCGKTTLMSQFANQTTDTITWLSVDADDNQPHRFWQYVHHALMSANVTLDDSALTDFLNGEQSCDDWLVTLINQIIAHDDELYLVLDDYHNIINPDVHNGLKFLIENAPSNFHIIIATRTEPPLPLPRFRAKNQLLEFHTKDLRFTPDEARPLVMSQIEMSVSDMTLEQLVDNTEGWIAGIHLALIAAKQHDAPDAMLQSISGTHRYIFDYLINDVLKQQPDDVQSFLLATAFLDEFSADLCDTLLVWDHSQQIIKNIIKSNLFVVSLDHQHQWFRYHHLFREVLLGYSNEALSADEIKRNHQQAAIWLHQHEHYRQALAHAMSASDFDLAVNIILDSSAKMFAYGYIRDLRQWMDELPEGMLESNWRMCIVYAWTLRFVRDVNGVEQYIARAEVLLYEQSLDDDDMNWYRAEQAGLQAFVAYVCGDNDEVLRQYKQLMQHKTQQNHIAYVLTLLAVGGVCRRQGELDRARNTYRQVIQYAHESTVHLRLIAYVDLANLYISQGEFRLADGLLQEFLQYCDKLKVEPPMLGCALLNLATIKYEYNQLEEANHLINRTIPLIKRGGIESILIISYAYRFLIALVQEKWGVAHDALNHYENTMSEWDGAEIYQRKALSYRIDLAVHRGHIKQAQSMLDDAQIDYTDVVDMDKLPLYFSLLRFLIATEKLNEATILCDKLYEVSQQLGVLRNVAYLKMRYAIIYHKQGKINAALKYLVAAIADAQLFGLVRSIIAPYHATQSLLRLALVRNIEPEFVKFLLSHIEPDQLPLDYISSPLTNRELQILGLLRDGKSNQEIASELVIALSTVKRHIMNIYNKLDVHNRTQAVLQGQRLSLLD